MSYVKGGVLNNNFTVAWEQVFGEKFVDSVIKAVKQNKESIMKNDTFTLERLLGCEVVVKTVFGDYSGHVIDIIYKFNALHIESERCCNVHQLEDVLFFTEDGDEVTFDKYVQLYYGEQHESN